MRNLLKVFLQRYFKPSPTSGTLHPSLLPPSEEEIIEMMEDALQNGPPLTQQQREQRKSMKDLFDILAKAPLAQTTVIMNQYDQEDLLAWGAEETSPTTK